MTIEDSEIGAELVRHVREALNMCWLQGVWVVGSGGWHRVGCGWEEQIQRMKYDQRGKMDPGDKGTWTSDMTG